MDINSAIYKDNFGKIPKSLERSFYILNTMQIGTMIFMERTGDGEEGKGISKQKSA